MAVSTTIGGVGLRFVSFQQRADTKRGEVATSFNNRLQDGTDLPRRTWDGTTDAHPLADESALRLAIASGPVVCSGLTLYGESVLCSVSIESAARGPNVQSGKPDYTTLNVTMSITLREA
jgi:hypothetical protein